jgi:hypothetical protein
MKRVAGWSVAAVIAVALSAGPVMAEPAMIKQAKDAGLPAQNCQFCHTEKMPKKETFKPEDLNERGKWLVEEKKKRSAPKANAAWLKDSPVK